MRRASEVRKIGRLPIRDGTPARTPRVSQPWDVGLEESPLTGGIASLGMPLLDASPGNPLMQHRYEAQDDMLTDESDHDYVPEQHESLSQNGSPSVSDRSSQSHATPEKSPRESTLHIDHSGFSSSKNPSMQSRQNGPSILHTTPANARKHYEDQFLHAGSSSSKSRAKPEPRNTTAQLTTSSQKPSSKHAPTPRSNQSHLQRTPAHPSDEVPLDNYYASIDFDKITNPFTDTRRAQMRGLPKSHEAQASTSAITNHTAQLPQETLHESPSRLAKNQYRGNTSTNSFAEDVQSRVSQSKSHPKAAEVEASANAYLGAASPAVSHQQDVVPSSASRNSVLKRPSMQAKTSPAHSPTQSPAATSLTNKVQTSASSAPIHRRSSIRPSTRPSAGASTGQPADLPTTFRRESSSTAPNNGLTQALRTSPQPSYATPDASTSQPTRLPREVRPRASHSERTPRSAVGVRTPVRPTRSNRLLTEELLKWKRRCAQLEDELGLAQQRMDDLQDEAQLGSDVQLETQVEALQKGRERDRRAMRQRVRVLESHMAETKLKYDDRYWRLLTSADRTPGSESAEVQLVMRDNEILRLQSANQELQQELQVTRSHASFLIGLYQWRSEQAQSSGSDQSALQAHIAHLEQRLEEETRLRQRAEARTSEQHPSMLPPAPVDSYLTNPLSPPAAYEEQASVLRESQSQSSGESDSSTQLRPNPRPRVRDSSMQLTQGRPRKKSKEFSASPPAPPLESFGIEARTSTEAPPSAPPASLRPGLTPMLRRMNAPIDLGLDVESTPILHTGDASPAQKKKRKLLSTGRNFLRINEVREFFLLFQASATLSPGNELMMNWSPTKSP